eukprot:8893807-Ditylum_brightwellii.AAC.1
MKTVYKKWQWVFELTAGPTPAKNCWDFCCNDMAKAVSRDKTSFPMNKNGIKKHNFASFEQKENC